MIARQSPRDSAIYLSMSGADAQWGLQEHLLAAIFDSLAVANWQRGGDENATKPERLERPGVKKQVNGLDGDLQGKAVPIEDMNALLGW